MSVPVDPPPSLEAPARRVAETKPPDPEPEGPTSAPDSIGPQPPKAALGTLDVLVFDSAGSPVSGALVEAWPFDGGTVGLPSTPPALSLLTDGLGRCTVTLGSRSAKLVASKPAVGSSGILLVSGNQEEIRVELQPLSAIRGTILRADGTAAEGARVVARPAGITVAAGPPRTFRTPAVATAGASGEFEVEADAGGPFRVHAENGEEKTEVVRVWTKPGSVHELTLRFPGAFSISGSLLDPDGKPVAGGTVRAFERREDPLGGLPFRPAEANAKTGPDGGFVLRLVRPGEYMVAGSAEGFASSAASKVVLDEAGPSASLALSLYPPSAIAGHARWADGRPVAGRPIWASPDLGSAPAHERPHPEEVFGRASGETEEDGSYRLAPLHPLGSYTVSIAPDPDRRDSLVSKSGMRPGGAEVEIVVTEEEVRGAVLTGVVESGATGEPLRSYRLRLGTQESEDSWSSDGTDRRIEDPDGRFRIEGLRPGRRYAIEVEADGHATICVEPWVMGPEGKELRLRLPRPGSVEVRVVDASGRAVAYASVSARFLMSRPGMRGAGIRSRRTDESGLARIDGLTPGRNKVHAWLGERRAETEADVPPGATAIVEIRLGP
ncbi:MAG: carboxypeptidase regulatory-like domain-containing protein [Planctomycetes bacterium]|nr:carboxypeptidase regulatory-like domain-containing protein [Planctomycetota bacterium]